MANIDAVTLEVTDPSTARSFYDTALGLGDRVRFRATDAPSEGFRGYTLSLIVSQPANAHALFDAAVEAGAIPVKPVTKSLWGHGGVVQAPDGTLWQLSTSAKKDTGPATREFDEIVLLLGVEDVKASKKFYVERGLTVGRSVGSYADFALPSSPIGLGLYKRRSLAKTVGVPAEGSGSHRLVVNGDLGSVTDPDGFVWEPAGA
ncbi:glyoxalase [Antribacter gilvus]|uniref:glyoxalase n=1 Tax=Antribacter gilvus TaxID=2304675 RepID=UPI000F7B4E42|nr:glyoxalase [Antribacter gilvus]